MDLLRHDGHGMQESTPGVPDTSPAARYTTIVASKALALSMRVLDDRAVPSVKSQAWQGDWENHPYYYP